MTTVTLSFANNFWGKDDAGVEPLLQRMHNAKQTCDELKSFYNARSALEEDYARKLLQLSRKPLGSQESGSLRASLDVMRGEVEAMGKAHNNVSTQMKSELEEPLAAFAGAMKERRKIVQGGIEKLLKTKVQQTQTVNKTRDRYEQECLKIKGYLAQGHMVMGQEERKNKAKLEKTQINLATSNTEYEQAVKILEDTTGRWNRDWKGAADKFQDLEEERLDFMKSSLWSFANIASTVCVSDDASCEKIRLSLENCEVEKDIMSFIKEQGTGQEIPDPPKYINFCRGDLTDTQSEASVDDDNYSVAQFQRTINPSFRSSSPQPSMFESHNDPNSSLARDMGHHDRIPSSSRDAAAAPQMTVADRTRNIQQEAARVQYEQSKQGPVAVVPHEPYPMDGMTMLCRPGGGGSELSSAHSAGRPSSRDSNSEYSNPTSFSSQEPPSGKTSPVKQEPPMSPISERSVQKRKSGFFNSPFRRKKSIHEDSQGTPTTPSGRNTWSARDSPQVQHTPGYHGPSSQGNIFAQARSASPEAVDPRANFQLNVGNNIFDVATPDRKSKPSQSSSAEPQSLDPIAQALAELKGVTKHSSIRTSADQYHGIATPAPGAQSSARPGANAMANGAVQAAMRGTPPPAYDQPVSRLGAPQPAFTSKAMQKTTQSYINQGQKVYGNQPQQRSESRSGGYSSPQARPGTRGGPNDIPRATSPLPARSVSPRPGSQMDGRQQQYQQQQQYRAASPNPYRTASPNPYTGPVTSRQQLPSQRQQFTPDRSGGSGQFSHSRSASPSPYHMQQQNGRPNSSHINSMNSMNSEMSMQLAQPRQDDAYGSPRGGGGTGPGPQVRSMTGGGGTPQSAGRPQSSYGSQAQLACRQRSKSMGPADGRQLTRDGKQILHFARAMYVYTAAIPEELSFAKGDILAVLRLQDDGWWEAEIVGKNVRPGLVPSNYLQKC